MGLGLRMFNGMVWGGLKLYCRMDLREFEKVPQEGPVILAFNHINFLDAPLIRLGLRPRNVKAMVKKELLKNFLMRYLSNLWGAIPVERGGNPRDPFDLAGDFFRDKGILCVAPEGTRSGDGILQKAHGGLIILAHRFNVPILPVAHFGTENLWYNFKRFRRTDITVKVGELIHLEDRGTLKKSQREEELLRVMNALADLLPPEYRGNYGG